MKWNEYITLHTAAKKLRMTRLSSSEWYKEQFRSGVLAEKWIKTQMKHEVVWYSLRKPFYNIWPCVAEGLARTPLDLPCQSVIEPLQKLPGTILLRMAVGHELHVDDTPLYTVLASRTVLRAPGGKDERGLVVFCNGGEFETEKGLSLPILWNASFGLENGTVEDSLRELEEKYHSSLNDIEGRVIQLAVRLVLGVALIGFDPSIVDSVVLAKDADKYEKTKDPKYLERAKNNGVVGWEIGRDIEVSPHYRHPHFAIRWTGTGRTVPKLRPIKGCIVKRKMIAQIPTGTDETE